MTLRAVIVFAAVLTAVSSAPAPVEAAPLGGIVGPPPPGACLVTTCATLTYDPKGTKGSGTVVSDPEGISCTVSSGVTSGTCSYRFTTTATKLRVTLTLTPAPGTLCHISFSDPVPGPCTLTWGFDQDLTVSEPWPLLSKHTLSVSKSGVGSGTVTSEPAGIDCGSACSKTFDYGTKVTLTATADAGAVFKTWTGACNGQGATCTLTVTQATSTNAVFDLASEAGGAPGGGEANAGAGGTAPQADTTVAADVIAVSAGKSRLGRRVVRLELEVEEPLSAALRLARGAKTLASKRFSNIGEGNRVLTLVVPKGVKKGKATLHIELSDKAGNTSVLKRGVRIGKPGRAAAAAARAARNAATCPSFQAAGATWGAKTTNVTCGLARRIVRKLASKTAPLPGGRYPGRYSGMTCGGIVPGSKPRVITCTGNGRQIVAGRKP